MKYKFNLSYIENNTYIPIDLKQIKGSDRYDMKKIKSIDYFTTSFNDLDEVLLYLKQCSLIPQEIDKLYVTYDKKVDGKVIQEIYYYGEKLFYKNNIEQLRPSYSYSLIKNRIMYGKFIMYIIEHYRKIYKHRTFGTLYSIASSINEYGYDYLTPSEKNEYIDEINKFLNYIFYKKTKGGEKIEHRNIRDFICFISKEKVTYNYDKNMNSNNKIYDCINTTEGITYDEYKKYNKTFVEGLSEECEYEPYVDGNDYIAPYSDEEIIDDLNAYTKKLCIKKDNGEYE